MISISFLIMRTYSTYALSAITRKLLKSIMQLMKIYFLMRMEIFFKNFFELLPLVENFLERAWGPAGVHKKNAQVIFT